MSRVVFVFEKSHLQLGLTLLPVQSKFRSPFAIDPWVTDLTLDQLPGLSEFLKLCLSPLALPSYSVTKAILIVYMKEGEEGTVPLYQVPELTFY